MPSILRWFPTFSLTFFHLSLNIQFIIILLCSDLRGPLINSVFIQQFSLEIITLTNHEAPNYVIFPILLLLRRRFSPTAPFSNAFNTFSSLSMRHTHTQRTALSKPFKNTAQFLCTLMHQDTCISAFSRSPIKASV